MPFSSPLSIDLSRCGTQTSLDLEMNTVTPWVTCILVARSATPSPAGISRILALRWQELMERLSDPYRPELHYMRGPGPKWREKHGMSGRALGEGNAIATIKNGDRGRESEAMVGELIQDHDTVLASIRGAVQSEAVQDNERVHGLVHGSNHGTIRSTKIAYVVTHALDNDPTNAARMADWTG